MTTEIRVLIAEDHPMFRERLRQIIESEPTFQLVAEATDGATTRRLLQERQPEIALLDLALPERSGFDRPASGLGFELARYVRQEQLPVKIIFLTGSEEPEMLEAALELGARGYLLKESQSSEIIAALKAVAAGKHCFSPQLSNQLLDRRAHDAALVAAIPGLRDLTLRELDVLALVAEGQSSKEIATALQLSAGVVDNYRGKISQKLGLHGPNDLPKFLLKHKADITLAIAAARRPHTRE